MGRAPTGQVETLKGLVELHERLGRPVKPLELAQELGTAHKTVASHLRSMRLREPAWVTWLEWAGAYEPSQAGREVLAQEEKP